MSLVCQSPGTHFCRPTLASDGLMFHLLPLNTLCRMKAGQCLSLLEGPWSERGQHVRAAQPGTGSLITGTQRGVGQGSACKHKSLGGQQRAPQDLVRSLVTAAPADLKAPSSGAPAEYSCHFFLWWTRISC